MNSKTRRGRPRQERPQISAQQADLNHFVAAADDDTTVVNVAAGFKVDGAHCVAFNAARGKGCVAILPTCGDGDTYATRN